MRSLLAVGIIVLAGCSGGSKTAETKATETGIDPKKDPLGAMGAISQMAKEAEKAQQEIADMPAVEPLHFSKLIEALPDVPDGWKGDEAKGESSQMGDMKLSQASRTYRPETGDSRVRIVLHDWAYHRALYLPFMMQAKFSQESTDRYSKGIEVGGDPGREEYRYKGRDGKRNVLVHKRYNVEVNIQNMEPAAFEEWWGRVKFAQLPAK